MSNYACSDLHGQYDLYKKIKSYINENDTVYFLGDAVDRGPESWKTFKAVYEDPQFIFLKGNHEQMLVAAMEDYVATGSIKSSNCQLYYSNGGRDTLKSWINEGADPYWIDKIKKLLLVAKVKEDNKTIILCHAGYTPEYRKPVPTEDSLLWSRSHFKDHWDFKNYSDTYIVHGHTPWCYLDSKYYEDDDPVIISYGEGHKFCIDCGSFYTGITTLFDLKTFNPIYFSLQED